MGDHDLGTAELIGQPRAVYIDEPTRLRVAPAEAGEPNAGEALVRIAWAGICGSDREVLSGGRPAQLVRYPVVPGHEWSGTVVSVGAEVHADLVGRPVVGENFRSCQRCDACRRGDSNLCQVGYAESGFTLPGAWADYLTVPVRLLHVLPDGADLRAAAGLEPSACVAAACLKAAPVPGEAVAVVGGGTLGLLTTQLVRASHPAELTVVEPLAQRAELARRCGASTVLTPDKAAAVLGRFDLVIEAAGVPGAARLAVTLARRGGRVVLTGLAAEDDQPLSASDLVQRAVTVHTVFGAPSRAWSHAVRAFASGVLDPGLLVTHELPLDQVGEAFTVLADPGCAAVKVLLRP